MPNVQSKATPKQTPRSSKRTALGKLGVTPSGIEDIVGEQVVESPPEQNGPRTAPAVPPRAEKAVMSSVYLRPLDVDRVAEIEQAVRRAKRVGGKIGLSLIVRAGVRALSEEIRKSEQHGVDLVVAASIEGE